MLPNEDWSLNGPPENEWSPNGPPIDWPLESRARPPRLDQNEWRRCIDTLMALRDGGDTPPAVRLAATKTLLEVLGSS